MAKGGKAWTPTNDRGIHALACGLKSFLGHMRDLFILNHEGHVLTEYYGSDGTPHRLKERVRLAVEGAVLSQTRPCSDTKEWLAERSFVTASDGECFFCRPIPWS